MAAVIQNSIHKVKNELNPYLYNNRISPFLGLAEQKIHLERSIIAFGLLGILAIYLVIGWGNDFVCNFIGILYPVYASLSAVQLPGTYDNKRLLIYWIVYSSLTCVEYLGHSLFHALLFYWLAKCIFLIWFMKSGSRLINRRFIQNTDILNDVQDGSWFANYSKIVHMADEDSKQNLNENNTDVVGKSEDLSQKIDEHAINRPPKPPGPTLGPYFQFLTTDLERMQWIGSVLIFRHVSFNRPKVEFISDVKIDYNWEILYENLFNMSAYRINLNIELRPGEGNEKILWKIDWGNFTSNGTFYIAQHDQKWRGGFFSCNGFDATIPKEKALGLNYDNVWNHLNSIHEKTPLHILLWGGDQSYNDFVIEDVPYLQNWSQLPFDDKWTYEFDDDSKKQVEQYYFDTYAEHWERRPEMKRALGSIPSLMMWDDHDIFDGAGSYPPLLQQSPIMTGLFEIAQKIRLLFQHHTTPKKARQHRLFGYQGHNYLARCGPKLVILGTDGRSERTAETVQHEKTWDIIFDQLDKNLENVEHLIVLVAIPFSFARFRLAESILERLKNFALKFGNMSIFKQANSVFGLPEIYDDLLDEWTHNAHIGERNRVLQRFQTISQEKKVRITFFSGDVHCCGIGRFRTHAKQSLLPVKDNKLMYQIISSAIVNMPPPRIFIRAAHFFATKWYPFENTEEEIINFFEKMPEGGSRLYLKKLLPNRNWCYFEQSVETISADDPSIQTGFFETVWLNILSSLFGLGFNRFFKWGNKEETNKPTNQGAREENFPENIETNQEQRKTNNLKIRLWLESTEKEKNQQPQFAGYDLGIPNLE